ncbi:hypothetical protein DACRYDRAFT_90564 [Dacryopinax primogenitus]|uniref:Cytochrome P450 n=1 Tax=Dacryopinax primogenitus (strain DJM 731) TaxID=1858805 RepID=M5FTW9_DACPD|nr:uncharacterized protein DACRYDRAFT_90564 [Dacryopinax primogenitus]EJT98914.1 hypothetical protein DACRYDRAFT_90564 [Dacryopinax primogenitus]
MLELTLGDYGHQAMDHLSSFYLGSTFNTRGGILTLILVILVTAHCLRRKRNSASRFPPGPTGVPLLGNVLQLPSKFFWYQLDTWSKLYGPVYTFWIMNRPIVVLSTVSASADVLDRQSGITADRAQSIKGAFYGIDQILSNKMHSYGCVHFCVFVTHIVT